MFLLLPPVQLVPQRVRDRQAVGQFFFQNAVLSLVRVVLLHEAVEQDTAVDKFDPRSTVEPYIRMAR